MAGISQSQHAFQFTPWATNLWIFCASKPRLIGQYQATPGDGFETVVAMVAAGFLNRFQAHDMRWWYEAAIPRGLDSTALLNRLAFDSVGDVDIDCIHHRAEAGRIEA